MMSLGEFATVQIAFLLGAVCLSLFAVIIYFFAQQIRLNSQVKRLKNANAQLKEELEALTEGKSPQDQDPHKYDKLTGLYNRPFFLEDIEEILTEAKQQQHRAALYLINLDNFKDINEQVGPKSGDLLLQEVANRLEKAEDADKMHFAHLGADEFAVLLPQAPAGSKAIQAIAAHLMQQIQNEPIHVSGKHIMVSVSVGISVFPETSKTGEELLQYADIALHHAKKLGKGELSFFTKDMRQHAKERLEMVNELRIAIKENQLELFYQPKVLTNSGKIYGAEALIRWHHPSRGYISPEVFVPVAEKSGLIGTIGEWIIKTACRQTAELHAKGYKDLNVAINLSANQFNKGDVAGIIAHEIWKAELPPECVELELTESLIMGNPEKSILMLRVLKAMKVRLAVDDFGTGYSSLSQLKQFPIDTLKIDQCFVKNVHNDPENLAIVSTIAMMGKKLGLKLVAEGVECDEEFEVIKKEGIDLIQGFFFSKPLPFNDYLQALENNRHIEP